TETVSPEDFSNAGASRVSASFKAPEARTRISAAPAAVGLHAAASAKMAATPRLRIDIGIRAILVRRHGGLIRHLLAPDIDPKQNDDDRAEQRAARQQQKPGGEIAG